MAKKETRFDSADRVMRFDLGTTPINSVVKTPQGFLRIPARLTRTGVLKYKTADGRTIRELRHPDDVMAPESLASLDGAPLTIGHKGLISPENVAEHQTGFVGSGVSGDGEFANGVVTVQRKDAIDGVSSKRLKELSPGYECIIDPTPGTYQGQRYDQRQTNIVYNHVALLAPGAGRSGAEVALRNDDAFSVTEETTEAPSGAEHQEIKMAKVRVTFDGVSYEPEVADALAVNFESGIRKLQTERADAVNELAKTQGQLAAEQQKNKDLQTRFDATTSPTALAQLVQERAAVEKKATALVPDIRCDGKDLHTIRREVLKASGFVETRFDDAAFVEGAFEALAVPEVKKEETPAQLPGISMKREDAKEQKTEMTADQARAAMMERNSRMYLGIESL